MTEPLAQLSEVTFGYQRKEPVIRALTAEFHAGAVCAVSGPSGCGKSTILSLLGLLLSPQSGRVTVLGNRCDTMHDRARSMIRRHHIGFVFQDALLETSMTVWQNLYEALPPRLSLQTARQRASASLNALGLPDGILDRKALTLSGGQAQRVAVVRALLKEPELVLADEPTGNLDDTSGRLVLDALFEYGRQPGRACVIVTHDVRIVRTADTELRIGP